MRFVYFIITALISIQAFTQVVSDFRIDTLLSEEVNPVFPSINNDGTKLLFTSQQTAQLYFLDLTNGIISQLTAEENPIGAGSWFPNEDAVVYVSLPQRQLMKKTLNGKSKYLLSDRDVFASTPVFNHEGNLMAFVGRRENQKEHHIFTYDFVYNNLNQLTEKFTPDYPQWSPSDEQISCSKKEGYRSKIVLLNWYGKLFGEIESDSLNLHDASWAESNYKLVFIGDNDQKNYLMISRRDGSALKTLITSNQKLSKPIWIPRSEKIVVLLTTNQGKNILLQISLDEQTKFKDDSY